jgi:putative transposase
MPDATGRSKAALVISADEWAQLASMARSRSLPVVLTLRARIVLACARRAIKWWPGNSGSGRTRSASGAIALSPSGWPGCTTNCAAAGRGRSRMRPSPEVVAKVLATKPTAGTHWTVRAMATETPLSKSAVHRFFQLFGLQPHRTRSFKLSSDPFFVDKLRDVVGLYLNPPSRQGPCPARRREEPSPGAGAYPAHAADGRLCRGGHPRR